MPAFDLLTETERAFVNDYCAEEEVKANMRSVSAWKAQQWGDFLAWLIEDEDLPDCARVIFNKIKADVFASFEDFRNLRGGYGNGNTYQELYEDETEFTAELFDHITSADQVINFIFFHAWEEIEPARLAAKFKEMNVRPWDWLDAQSDQSISCMQPGDFVLMAAHWESCQVEYQEWQYAAYELLESRPNCYNEDQRPDDTREDVPHYPEVVLLMEIAQRKMREIVQAVTIFR